MSDWPTVRFYELANSEKSSFSKPYGSAMTKEDYLPQGVPVVRGVNLARGRFHDDEFVFIATEKAREMPGANLGPGDLVFTHRGTIGQVSMIPRTPRYERYVASTSQVKVRLDQTRALPEFYYYWFLSPSGRHELLGNVSTVGVPGLGQPVATIKSLKVPHPPLHIQRAIAAVLGALDDSIAANDRMLQTLRELRQAFYLDSIAVAPVESTVEATATFHNNRRQPLSSTERTRFGGPFPYYGANGVVDSVADYRFDGQFVLVGEDGTVVTDSGSPVVHWAEGRFWVSNHAHVLSGTGISNEFLAESLRAADIRPYVTGAVQPKVSMGNLKKLSILLPPVERRAVVEARLRDLVALGRGVEAENSGLAELRDTMLPRLMSGEIRVRDAEKIVAEVL